MNLYPEIQLFKSCPNCDYSWQSQDDFLSDPLVDLIGYQVHFELLEEGLFLFNHLSCKTTLSVISGKFGNLYDGPIYSKNMVGEEECPEYCLNSTRLDACPVECECVYVREIIQSIKGWKKELK